MSGVAIVRYLLANNAGLTAVVPATKIMAGPIPLNTVLPAISVAQISGVQRLNVAMNVIERLTTDRVQVTVLAKTYPVQKSILALIRAACPNSKGAINGVDVDSILPDVESLDMYDDTTGICMQSQDFIVKFNR